MNPRLLILIALAGVLALYLATRTSAPAVEAEVFEPVDEDQDLAYIRETQLTLWERHLPGVEPSEPPEFDIQVEVDPSGRKNRLYYYISEAHGYYVESLNVEFWYMPAPDTTPDESPLRVPKVINDYIKANETYKGCLEVVPAELADLGGDMGMDENWTGRLIDYGRARAENPDRLPPLAEAMTCD